MTRARAGARAASDLLQFVLGDPVEKALDPLKRRDFVLIVDRIAAKLAGVAGDAEAAVVAQAIDELDVDWASLGTAGMDAVVRASNEAIAQVSKVVVPKLNGVIEAETTNVMQGTRRRSKSTYDLEIKAALTTRDLSAEKAIRTTAANFVRDEYGRVVASVSARARDIVASGIGRGLDPVAIGKHLADNLDTLGRPESYWNVVATAFANKGRTASSLFAYDDAGIKAYKFMAVLDEVTTDVCRFFDGQEFATSDGLAVMERLMEIEDPEDVAKANPWVRVGSASDGRKVLFVDRGKGRERVAVIARSGVGAKDDRGEYTRAAGADRLVSLGIPWPPLHGRCRSTIVPA